MVEHAKSLLETGGVADRCEYVAGDFFDQMVVGDIYILSQILHDWDDQRAMTILRNCRLAAPTAIILIVERLIPEDGTFHPSRLTDLNMLVMLGGRERTRRDFERLLTDAQLQLRRVLSLPDGWSLLEALPVP